MQKPGIKTSEFWITAAVVFAAVLWPQLSGEPVAEKAGEVATHAGDWLEEARLIVGAFAAAIYTRSRTTAKRTDGAGASAPRSAG